MTIKNSITHCPEVIIVERVINGYKVIGDMHISGFSQWGYAKKNGREYFIKEFLEPKYPVDNTVSEAVRNRMMNECREFVRKHDRIYKTINECSCGHIVRTYEFFREKSKYYIVTEKINNANIKTESVAKENIKTKLLLCMVIALDLSKIHKKGMIHSDIKADNILLKRTHDGSLSGKIIDFDCSFFEDEGRDGEEINGDMVYFSPEMLKCIVGEEAVITHKSDIFSIGILFHQYFTGSLPIFDIGSFDSAAEAVLEGNVLTASGITDPRIGLVIEKMLSAKPQERPELTTVYEIFRRIYLGENFDIRDYFDTKFVAEKVRGYTKKEEVKEASKSVEKKKTEFTRAADL